MAPHFLLSFFLLFAASVFATPAAPAPLTSISAVRALSRQEAATAYPVKVRGVIVYHEPRRWRTFVSDGVDSIFVLIHPYDIAPGTFEAGMEVEVEGFVGAGEFTTCIEGRGGTSAHVRILGRAPLPAARAVSRAELTEPMLDSRWIETRGIVRGVSLSTERALFDTQGDSRHALLDLEIEGELFKTLVIEPERASDVTLPWHLVERSVHVRAVVGSIFNRQGQMTGRILFVPSMNEIGLESPAPAAAEELPLRALDTLLTGGQAAVFCRTRVRGVVTFAPDGQGLYLRGDGIGLWVQTAQPTAAVPGSVVEVIGIPALASFRPYLRAIEVREVRRESPPQPLPVSIPEMKNGLHHGDLVSLDATLLKTQMADGQSILQLDGDSQLFQARFEGVLPGLSLEPGSRLRLQGICLARTTRVTQTPQVVDSFMILLRAPADIAILAVPSWWTTARMLLGLGIVGAVAFGAFVWVWLLRRRVVLLSGRIQREAIHGERLRIARDLHDDLGARVTHLSSLAALGEQDAGASPQARRQFAIIRSGSREMVQALDAAVWTVDPENDSLPSLATYLCQWAGDFFQSTPIRCRFEVAEDLPERALPLGLRHEVFLALKEALNNAARHSGGSEVWLRVGADAHSMRIRVEDDGRGGVENARAGSGLKNMRQRISRLGGTVRIESPVGGGTLVAFCFPLS